MFPSRFPSSAQPGNNNNGERLRRRNDPRGTLTTQNHRHPLPPILYNPAIFSYKCYGKYHTASDDNDAKGTCTGIESQIEMYDIAFTGNNHHAGDAEREWVTRAEALKRFTTLTADIDLADYQGGNAKSELNQQTRSVLISPALIYKESESKTRKQHHQQQQQQTTLPEEDLIRRQEWTCYGMTVVEVLALEEADTGEKTIAAVNPKSVGVSVREIETTDDSVRTLTRLGLGWLDIVLDSETQIVDAATPVPSDAGERMDSSDDDNMRVTAQKALQDAREFSGKTYECSRKIVSQMKYNVLWLNENVRDDFPARTYAAGRQLVANIPTVAELTGKYMAESFRKWLDDFDDDHDD